MRVKLLISLFYLISPCILLHKKAKPAFSEPELIQEVPDNASVYNLTYIEEHHIDLKDYLNKNLLCKRKPLICKYCCFSE